MEKSAEKYGLSKNAATTGDVLQLVSFKLGTEIFGVNILQVREINRMLEITKMPGSPDFVEGVINLRGRVIPVISLRKRLNLENKAFDEDSRIIIVESESKILGFIVDSVSEVFRVPASSIEPPPSLTSGVDVHYLQGVCQLNDHLIVLLNLNKVLSEREIEQLGEAA